MHQHNTREAAVPIFTTETEDSCDNVLVPPRALAFDLPDNARWAARAAQVDGAWAWHRRINRALFRGSTTGGAALNGTGHASSKRAKVVAFSLRHPELLDARFTTRGGVGAVQAGAGTSSLEAELLRLGMAERGAFLTWYDALRYRAALVVDGNTVADRLPFVMASATAVIKVDSPRREAFYSLLRPYEHYVPVRAGLSDLEAQLRWALANETRLHAIARNGAAFALRHLSRRATLCHWTSLLLFYATRMAGPVQLDADAVRVPARPPTSLPMIIEPVLVQGFALTHLLRPWALITPQLSTGREHASLLQLIATLPPTRKRKLAAWCDFQFDGDNPVRLAIWRQLRSSPESAAATSGPLASLAKHEIFATKAQYMFDVSPPGHGIDCFRTWEALALGMIPIVLRSGTPLDELLRELPVVLVANFSEVTLPQLRVWARGIEERRQRKAWRVVRVPVPTVGAVPVAGLICGDCATEHRGAESAHDRVLAADVAARARQA